MDDQMENRKRPRLMTVRASCSTLAMMAPGEKVLFSKPRLWFWHYRGPWSYRFNLSCPVVAETGLYITDKRLLLIFGMMRLIFLEHSIAIAGADVDSHTGRVTGARVARSRLLGRYVEILFATGKCNCHVPKQGLLRFYMKAADALSQIINDAVANSRQERGGATARGACGNGRVA